MRKGLFKNEVGKEELDRLMCFESFPFEEPIKPMTRFIERLTDADIDYAIEQDNRKKCFNIYINSTDRLKAIDALEE